MIDTRTPEQFQTAINVGRDTETKVADYLARRGHTVFRRVNLTAGADLLCHTQAILPLGIDVKRVKMPLEMAAGRGIALKESHVLALLNECYEKGWKAAFFLVLNDAALFWYPDQSDEHETREGPDPLQQHPHVWVPVSEMLVLNCWE